MLENPKFLIYCNEFKRAGGPEEMLGWINTRLLPSVNVDAHAAREARKGNLGPAANQVSALVKQNVAVALRSNPVR